MKQLFTISAVAKQLNIPNHRIVYLIQSGRVPEPFRLSGRRIFTQQDVARITTQLNQQQTAGRPPRRKENDET